MVKRFAVTEYDSCKSFQKNKCIYIYRKKMKKVSSLIFPSILQSWRIQNKGTWQWPDDADSSCLLVNFIITSHVSPSLALLYRRGSPPLLRPPLMHYASCHKSYHVHIHVTIFLCINFRSTVLNLVLKFVPVKFVLE